MHKLRSQRTTWRVSWVSPSTMWVPEIELRSSDLVANALYLFSRLTSQILPFLMSYFELAFHHLQIQQRLNHGRKLANQER